MNTQPDAKESTVPSEKLLKSSQVQSREALAAMLESLAGRIREGNVELGAGSEQIALQLPAHVDVDVDVTREAKTSGTKLEFEVEVSWREGEDSAGGELRIG